MKNIDCHLCADNSCHNNNSEAKDYPCGGKRVIPCSKNNPSGITWRNEITAKNWLKSMKKNILYYNWIKK